MKLLHQLVLLAIILIFSVPAIAAQEIGSVSEVLGDVDILRGGKLPAEIAKVGAKVAQGDVIRTKSGGKVQLSFKDDSALTIAPDSRVALNEYVYEPENNKREASIKIFQGLVHTVVSKVLKKDTPDFTVETQTAIIGVRGTDYFTLVGPAVSDIYNNSGTTEINNIFAEIPGKVTLRGREYTKVSKNLPPTLPLPLTQDDINWIRGQMNPRMVAKSTGSGSTNPQQLMSNVAGNAIRTSNVSTPTPAVVMPNQTNVIENLQSAVYVPPQPVPLAPVHVVPVTLALPTPFNIAIAWQGSQQMTMDFDLYVTANPSGTTAWYGAQPQPTNFYLTGDSIGNNGGEVVVVKNWTAGQIYYAYVKNFNYQSDDGSMFTTANVAMQLSKGGTPASGTSSSGTTYYYVTGATPVGQAITPPTPTTGNSGSQWQVVSIDPSTGTITPLNKLVGYGPDPLPTTAAAAVTPTNSTSTPALSPTMQNSIAATATSTATTSLPAIAPAMRPATTVIPATTAVAPRIAPVAPVKTTVIPTATTMAPTTPSAAATVAR
jgi:hypothetical protein